MTAPDRAALADALASATAETLRRLAEERAAIADLLLRDIPSWSDGRAELEARARDHRIVAALALAVSRAMDFDSRVEQAYGRDYLILDIGLPDAHGLGYGGCDLPAALAALLKGDQ